MGGGACERMRWRFGLLGEGETGSPRNRFRARETAAVDTGWPCEEDACAFGCSRVDGNGSGEVRVRGLAGVANGFAWGEVREGCVVDFLAGEKGLKPGRGGTGSAGRDFGAGRRVAAALESCL